MCKILEMPENRIGKRGKRYAALAGVAISHNSVCAVLDRLCSCACFQRYSLPGDQHGSDNNRRSIFSYSNPCVGISKQYVKHEEMDGSLLGGAWQVQEQFLELLPDHLFCLCAG